MILLDLSPTIYSTFLVTHDPSTELDEGYIRHLILNSIRSYLTKFRSEYGKLVICCDSSDNWRKQLFPYYKAGRKKSRDNSGFDWDKVFGIMNKIRDEIRDNFPYKFMQVNTVEADDIIAVLSKKYANSTEKILIISVDKDFKQLQKYDNVKQYNTVKKEWVVCDDPLIFLKEHIIHGDKSDGIPNFLSDDDTFVSDKRQTPIRKAKLESWVTQQPEQYCDYRMMRNYTRNRNLIDMDYIPENISSLILDEFAKPDLAKQSLYAYFMKHKLNNLMGSIGEF